VIKKKLPLVWIVVLHWRGVETTTACLNSLSKLDYQNYRVLLVDNGSENRDGSILGKQFPQISILRLEENLGFAGGCNAGMKLCLEQKADYIWLLNNDATVSPKCVSLLVEEAEKNAQAGAIGALIKETEDSSSPLDSAGTTNSAYGKGVIDFLKAKTYLRNSAENGTVECDWLSGSNLLLRAEALRKVGLFDERYFLYFEDADLCYRLRLAGWKCLLVTKAVIYHTGGKSTPGKLNYWRAYYYTRNRFLFFKSHTSGLTLPIAFLSIFAHVFRHMLILPLRGDTGKAKLRAELLGFRDYFAGNFGRAICLDWCNE
jgi:GT2 family glycosyltransferase